MNEGTHHQHSQHGLPEAFAPGGLALKEPVCGIDPAKTMASAAP